MFRLNNDYEVLTPSGFKSFNGVQLVQRKIYKHIIFDDKSDIKCSLDHAFGEEKIKASSLSVGDSIQGKTILYAEDVEEDIQLYDLIDVADGNLYKTNEIVSHNCEFLGSQFTLIDPKFLRQMYPDKPKTFNDRTAIYEEPEPNKLYVMTCDVARGVNLDYSAISVIDVTQVPYKMVARFKANNVTVQEFPKIIYELGIKYNEAFCMVEINDVGQQVADILERDLEYENMVSTSFKGRDGVKISSGFGGVHMVNGLRTTLKTKKIGCSNLKTLIENKKLIANDFEVISELSTFISTGQTFAADKGKNDDIVMTLVMFGWMTTQDYFKNLTDTDYVQNLLQERKEEMDSMLPFGFINSGDGYEDDGLVL
jgi:hypothetical protein